MDLIAERQIDDYIDDNDVVNYLDD